MRLIGKPDGIVSNTDRALWLTIPFDRRIYVPQLRAVLFVGSPFECILGWKCALTCNVATRRPMRLQLTYTTKVQKP